jgi:hypothetical protein
MQKPKYPLEKYQTKGYNKKEQEKKGVMKR